MGCAKCNSQINTDSPPPYTSEVYVDEEQIYVTDSSLTKPVARGLSYLFPMVQALHVILQNRRAFCGALGGVGGCVYDIAGEDFLPEGKAAGGSWCTSVIVSMDGIVAFADPSLMFVWANWDFLARTAVQAVAGCHCELWWSCESWLCRL